LELLKSVFGIGTSLGCTIPCVALDSDSSSNLRLTLRLSPPLPPWPGEIAGPDFDLSR
jgi:hypothetical protein